MNRPIRDPSQEGSRRSSASCQFPSWEGLGVGSWSQCMRKNDWRLSINPAIGAPTRRLAEVGSIRAGSEIGAPAQRRQLHLIRGILSHCLSLDEWRSRIRRECCAVALVASHCSP